MVAIAYLVPFLFCLFLSVGLDYRGDWIVYLWLVLGGETLVGLLHFLFYRVRIYSTEYIGSLVKAVYYEAAWTEMMPKTVTRRDSRGNVTTSVRIVEQRHPERYYFDTTRGTRKDTDREFFTYVLEKWVLPPVPDKWTDPRIKGGIRYGAHRKMDFHKGNEITDNIRWVSVTEKQKYKNKIINSNSIFKFRNVSKKEAERLGLFKYPEIVDYDSDCILSQKYEVSDKIQEKFRRFNGAFAPQREMRLYMLIYNAEIYSASISEYQREFWQGGNKNEFVICLGVNGEDKVEWSRTFSWADDQCLELETDEWFIKNTKLDLEGFYDWFVANYHKWQRKHFSDFKYINVTLGGWEILIITLASIIENALVLLFLLK